MTIPRPSADSLLAAVTILRGTGLTPLRQRVIDRVARWLDDQADLAQDEELDVQRQTGLGPDGERLQTPRDADDD